MKARILQNCFLPEQLEACTLEPHLNPLPATPDEDYLFLESNVIRTRVQQGWHVGFPYFGVLGHRWQAKLDESRSWGLPIRNLAHPPRSAQSLHHLVGTRPTADIISLGRFIPHAVFLAGDRCHPGLLHLTTQLLDSVNIRFDARRTFPRPIYFNYFLATPGVMEAYVRDLLDPVIQAATRDPALRRLCLTDSGYFRPFPTELASLYRIQHYPMHPFVGERLINIYVELSGLRVRSFDEFRTEATFPTVVSGITTRFHALRWRWRSRHQH